MASGGQEKPFSRLALDVHWMNYYKRGNLFTGSRSEEGPVWPRRSEWLIKMESPFFTGRSKCARGLNVSTEKTCSRKSKESFSLSSMQGYV